MKALTLGSSGEKENEALSVLSELVSVLLVWGFGAGGSESQAPARALIFVSLKPEGIFFPFFNYKSDTCSWKKKARSV